ncbi:basic proline-rich protein-like [Pan troglodytes]|uniref:basic proline-rich protein-like n=1 Tax=Pan troglodytes TaxID=9598 RepID=UPI0030140908
MRGGHSPAAAPAHTGGRRGGGAPAPQCVRSPAALSRRHQPGRLLLHVSEVSRLGLRFQPSVPPQRLTPPSPLFPHPGSGPAQHRWTLPKGCARHRCHPAVPWPAAVRTPGTARQAGSRTPSADHLYRRACGSNAARSPESLTGPRGPRPARSASASCPPPPPLRHLPPARRPWRSAPPRGAGLERGSPPPRAAPNASATGARPKNWPPRTPTSQQSAAAGLAALEPRLLAAAREAKRELGEAPPLSKSHGFPASLPHAWPPPLLSRLSSPLFIWICLCLLCVSLFSRAGTTSVCSPVPWTGTGTEGQSVGTCLPGLFTRPLDRHRHRGSECWHLSSGSVHPSPGLAPAQRVECWHLSSGSPSLPLFVE